MNSIIALLLLSVALYGQGLLDQAFFPFPTEKNEASTENGEGLDFFSLIPTAPKELEITNIGAVEYKKEQEELVYRDTVVVKADSGVQIYADKATINLKEKTVKAEGNTSIYNGPILFNGSEAVYNYETQSLITDEIRTGLDPFLIKAKEIRNVEREGKAVLIAKEAAVTTDDYENPGFWLKAEQISVYPNDQAIFRDMKLEVGGKTLFWLPYFSQSLDKDLGYHFMPGGQEHLGFFWKNRYGFYLGGEKDKLTGKVSNPDSLMQLYLDPYSRRGVGLGAALREVTYEEDEALGLLSAYWIYDFAPDIQRITEDRSALVEHNRFRLEVKDRWEMEEVWGGALRLDSNLTYLSDAFFLEDYFQSTFRVEPQPDNLFSLTHVKGNYLTNLSARLQLNSFYETDERLPELTVDRARSTLFGSGVFYESQSSIGFLRESLADAEKSDLLSEAEDVTTTVTRADEISGILDETGFFRAHTWHEFSLPYKTGKGIIITPRFGTGFTYYATEDGAVSDGRFLSNFSLDVAMRLSKHYAGLNWESLGLDSLTHIIQPYSKLSLLDVSGLDGQVTPVDRLTAITRPRPINVGRYSAIDELDDWSILRTGVRQSFVTKRNAQPHHWLYWDSYFDILLGENDAPNSLSNLYNEFYWNPLPWMQLVLETQFPISNSENDFSEVYLGTTFMVGRSAEVKLGYSWLKNHPILEDSNQVLLDLYYRINDEWGIGTRHQWQLDDSTLEFQRYALHRNMQSWILSAEVYQRDFRVEREWGFSIGFTLRDFPDISLPVGIQR